MTSAGSRKINIARKTNETDIKISLNIDGTGKAEIDTGVPFIDHMLTLFAVHGFFDLTIKATGDTQIDDHHTVEDLGICLGQAFKDGLHGFKGICRYGESAIPMDETLVRVTADFSNRPFLHYGAKLADQKVGKFDTALAQEFLRALSLHAGLTLHVEVVHGENTHHILEAIFKSLGKTLDRATTIEPRATGALSSKGSL
ncbi:MAG: imidazoleglycerol-phosphate dehydratase HisB [Proteobacteria bacterium]|nr:imidazoleglycerol-phosphate dehydratase HisB [Pseudomonadota bacterium]MBU1716363.1 imidazoleglycerol-phosphate dehydratase HisB [Pseudomonadota bacterium]